MTREYFENEIAKNNINLYPTQLTILKNLLIDRKSRIIDAPRQSGKTYLACIAFLLSKDIEFNGCLLCRSARMQEIGLIQLNRLGINGISNVFSERQRGGGLATWLRGMKIDWIIIDDYMSFDNRESTMVSIEALSMANNNAPILAMGSSEGRSWNNASTLDVLNWNDIIATKEFIPYYDSSLLGNLM